MHYILILEHGTPLSEACEKENNQPHIVLFCDEDEDDEGMARKYFVCVEQELMMESSNIVAAVFFCIAGHYIFNFDLPSQNGRFLAVQTGENPWPTFKGWSEVC